MKKTIISLLMLSLSSISASSFVVTLDDKHYKTNINIQEYTPSAPSAPAEPVGVVGEYSNTINGVNDPDGNGIKMAKLKDNIWDCSISGTYTSSEVVTVDLSTPTTINYLTSAGMARLWKYPLTFYAVVEGQDIELGSILTSGYCGSESATKLTFDTLTTSQIKITSPENMYIGEIDFGFEE